MKPHKGTMLLVLFGLLVTVFAIGLAQTQSPQAKQETTPSMDSCCCKGDSCSMKSGASSTDKKHGDDCCGDSCDLKMQDRMKNHAEGTGCCCCSGDSCDMKKDAVMKNHASAAGCCCSSESCEMSTSESMTSQGASHECCCTKMHDHHKQQMKAKPKAA